MVVVNMNGSTRDDRSLERFGALLLLLLDTSHALLFKKMVGVDEDETWQELICKSKTTDQLTHYLPFKGKIEF